MKRISQAFMKPYVTEKYIYAANLLGNSVKCFFRIDRETSEVKLLSLLSGEKAAKSNEHRAVFEYKGKCFIFSFHNYDVISYDLTTGEEMYYSPCEEYFFQYIQSIIQIQDQVWIFQDVLNPLIMVFSLTTYTYEKKEVDLSRINHKDKAQEWGCGDVFIIGREVWRAVYRTNQMLGIHLDSMEARVCRMPVKDNLFSFNFIDGKGYFLNDKMELIITSDTFEILKMIEAPSCVTIMDYCNVAVYHDRIIYLPCYFNKLIYTKLNSEKHHFFEISLPEDFSCEVEELGLMYEYIFSNEHLLLFPFGGNGLVDVDLGTLKTKNHKIILPTEEQMLLELKSNGLIREEMYSIEQFLKVIVHGN